MIIPCQNINCGFNINISDEKIPDKPMKVPCPKCKQLTPVNPVKSGISSKQEEQSQNAGVQTNKESNLKNEMLNIIEEKFSLLRSEIMRELGRAPSSTEKSDFHVEKPQEMNSAPGGERVLICDNNELNRKQINNSLSELGFKADEATTVDEAIITIKNASAMDQYYTMIFINKGFPGDNEGGHKILNEITSLPLHIRRRCYVAFISDQLRTGDTSAAFLMGANTVVNTKDLPKLIPIVKEETSQYENLYKAFNLSLYG